MVPPPFASPTLPPGSIASAAGGTGAFLAPSAAAQHQGPIATAAAAAPAAGAHPHGHPNGAFPSPNATTSSPPPPPPSQPATTSSPEHSSKSQSPPLDAPAAPQQQQQPAPNGAVAGSSDHPKGALPAPNHVFHPRAQRPGGAPAPAASSGPGGGGGSVMGYPATLPSLPPLSMSAAAAAANGINPLAMVAAMQQAAMQQAAAAGGLGTHPLVSASLPNFGTGPFVAPLGMPGGGSAAPAPQGAAGAGTGPSSVASGPSSSLPPPVPFGAALPGTSWSGLPGMDAAAAAAALAHHHSLQGLGAHAAGGVPPLGTSPQPATSTGSARCGWEPARAAHASHAAPLVLSTPVGARSAPRLRAHRTRRAPPPKHC